LKATLGGVQRFQQKAGGKGGGGEFTIDAFLANSNNAILRFEVVEMLHGVRCGVNHFLLQI